MDDLRISLELIFNKVDIKYLLERHIKNNEGLDHSNISENIDKEKFKYLYTHLYPTLHSLDEVEQVLNLMEDKWMKDYDLDYKDSKNIFNVLNFFNQSIFSNDIDELQIRYDKLLKWREISQKLGEDIFTSSFYAYYDTKSLYNRSNFSWRPILRTDNQRVKQILKKGMAENHMHLKGSAPHFQLSWISIMNDIKKRERDFKNLNKKPSLNGDINKIFNCKSEEETQGYYILALKAAYIRMTLFKLILDEKIEEKNIEIIKIMKMNLDEIQLEIDSIQAEIDSLKYIYSGKIGGEYVDYCIPKNIYEDNYNGHNLLKSNILLYGERYFLYSIFKKIYNQKNKEIWDLFYIYLVIKSKIRSEIIQVNDRVGFANFADYQDRKSYFIKKSSIASKAIKDMAINGSREDQNIKRLEARIGPESTYEELASELKELDKIVDENIYDEDKIVEDKLLKKLGEDKEKNYFYVIHFIKNKDKLGDHELNEKPRNDRERETCKKQAKAIIRLRESSNIMKDRIYGIDGANFEIGCRPEVFSQVFRYLRNHKQIENLNYLEKQNLNRLGFTYHAGEDFLDIVDGLRAIDEAICFLDLQSGDRLGHALALGLDVDSYFKSKKYTSILARQEILDNAVWLYNKMIEYNILNIKVLDQLEQMAYSQYNYIYKDELEKDHKFTKEYTFDIKAYFSAYKLRGDNPEVYYENKSIHSSITYWDKMNMRLNEEEILKVARENNLAKKIYTNYHYSLKVKKKGREADYVKISPDIVKVISEVQKNLQKTVSKKNIYVEANPSSNYLISTFKRYSEHPIVSLYNKGLVYSDRERKCPQINVSINTDDQGVFATYLENEYALMAISLEKELDENNEPLYKHEMIYDWLENIRKNGLEQSFNKKL